MRLLYKIAGLLLFSFISFKSPAQNLPPSLTCVRNGNANEVILNWVKPSPLCGTFISYDIFVATGTKAGPYSLLTSVNNVNQTTTTLNIPNTDSVFVYMVTVQDCGGISSSVSSDTADNSKERPPYVPFKVVTYQGGGVLVKWYPTSFPEVSGYLIYNESNNFSIPIAFVSGRSSDNYFDAASSPNTGPHTYKIRAFIDCDTIQGSQSIEPHHTIKLDTVISSRCGRYYTLSWNKYNNYAAGVSRYEIQISSNGGPFVRTVSAAATDSVINLSVTRKNVLYCIRLITYLPNTDTSESNTICFTTDVAEPPYQAFLLNATVEPDNTVRLVFGTDTAHIVRSYYAERSENPVDFKRIGTTDITGSIIPPPVYFKTFEDINSPDPGRKDYYYRFALLDECDSTIYTNYIRTVNLTGRQTINSIEFNWNAFQITNPGVQIYGTGPKYYELLKIDNFGIHHDSVRVDTSILHISLDADFLGAADSVEEYCFTIRTHYFIYNPIYTVYPGDSYSNTICFKPRSVAFVPNIFAPNGHNTTVKPNLILFDKNGPYTFKIFNRWAEEVFSTENYLEAWDGKYKDEDAPMDTYVFFLSYTGKDGEEHVRRGVITLMR